MADSFAIGDKRLNESVQRQLLSDKVYHHLKARLGDKGLTVGERVNIRQITGELKVSRSTVRKAIDRFIEDKLVKIDEDGHLVVSSVPAKVNDYGSLEFEFANQTESARELMLQRIMRGDYGPGQLINESRIAAELSVNPATIRRAAEWLRLDGMLERVPRRGWRVTLLTPRDLKDAYQIRMLLEPIAVAGAIQFIGREQLDQLMKQTERMIASQGQLTIYDRREADHQFHKTICAASGNRTLTNVLVPLIRQVLLITTTGIRYGRSVRSFQEHRDILNALMSRDEKEAVKRMKMHLQNAAAYNAEIWERQWR